jgi:hypothetical protein
MTEEQQSDDATDSTETSSQTSSGTSSTDSNSAASSSSSGDSSSSGLEESGPGDIGDDKLPEDLQPTEDNPLARHPGQTGNKDDQIGADSEGTDSANPSSNMAYSEGESNAPSDQPKGESDNAEVKAEEDDGSATLDNGGGGAG